MSTNDHPSDKGAIATAVLNGVIFTVSVAAFVLLEALQRDTTSLVLLVGPVIGAVFVTTTLKPQLTRVEQQTNGVLDERISRNAKAATTAALLDAGLLTVDEPGMTKTTTRTVVHRPDPSMTFPPPSSGSAPPGSSHG